jgi:hypothetical protein
MFWIYLSLLLLLVDWSFPAASLNLRFVIVGEWPSEYKRQKSSINEHEQDFTEFLQNDLATLNELNIDKNRKNVDKVKSRSGNNLLWGNIHITKNDVFVKVY